MIDDDDDDDDDDDNNDDDDDDDDIGDGRPSKGHLMDEMRRNRGWTENFRFQRILRVRGLSTTTAELHLLRGVSSETFFRGSRCEANSRV